MSCRPRPSVLGRFTAVILRLASASLLLASAQSASAQSALANEPCTHWPKTASDLVSSLEAPSEGAVICLAEGASHIFHEAYLDTPHALPAIHSRVTLRGQGEGSTIQRASTAKSAFGLLTVTGSGHLTLSNITLHNGLAAKTTPGGGAVFVESGSLTLDTATLTGNSAGCNPSLSSGEKIVGASFSSCGGGAINLGGSSSLAIGASTFSGNSAAQGGAIYAHYKSVLKIGVSTFSNNSADSGDANGGAIFSNSSYLTIETSTFSNNSSSNDGGAIYANNSSGSLKIVASTFLDSTSGTEAMFCGYLPSAAHFTSSIFEKTSGSVCCSNVGNSVDQDYSLFSDTSCGNGSSTDLNLSSPSDHGGPTETIALDKESPAIGKGSCVPGTTDQRGFQRRSKDFRRQTKTGCDPDQGDLCCDAGAFERVCPSKQSNRKCLFDSCELPCPNGICTIPIIVDFKKKPYRVLNSAGCEVDIIPSNATQVRWKLVPAPGQTVPVNAHDEISVTHIDFSANELQSERGERVSGQSQALRLNPCVFSGGSTLQPGEANPEGWVLCSYPNLKDPDPEGCTPYNVPPPGGGCNCAPSGRNSWWWYGVGLEGVDKGLWDPRMRSGPPEPPPDVREEDS